MSYRSFLTILVLAAAGTFPGESGARTWNVLVDGSGDSPTIQAGIDSAAVGDTVLVHPGTYNEVIDFLGKDIVVKSAGGPEGTTIDASGVGQYVVTFQSNESRAATLEGFTLTGGLIGILFYNAEGSVLSNTITGNEGTFSGGGVWMVGEPFDRVPTFRPLIAGNIISHNTATRIGGGIGTWQRMAPEITDNTIAFNEATEGDGGGIYLRLLLDDTGSIVRGNTIDRNYAGDHGGGFYGGPVSATGTVGFELSWNVVDLNQADGIEMNGDSGGGIWLSSSDAWVHHNTIVNNTGNGPNNSYGGGIVMERPGSPLIEKNIIALTQNGGGIWCGGGATPTIRNNLAWENLPADGVGDCPGWWQSDGNIVDDPAFCDAEGGNYAVAQNSPAMTHPAGPLGALYLPGCGPVSVQPTTWGLLKSRYLPGN